MTFRRIVTGALAAAALAAPAGALTASTVHAAAHDFPAKVDINGRQNIGDAADAPGVEVDAYRAGQNVPVECQQEKDGALWDRTADGLWVPDEYVKTGTDGRAPGVPECQGGTPTPPQGGERTIEPEVTAYTWQDNDPDQGRGDGIAAPTVHQRAGGVGTYEDPVTVAVGKRDGKYDYEPGTRFYIPSLKKYGVAEDWCGACSDAAVDQKIDIWIDGRESSAEESNDCAVQMTTRREVVVDAEPGKEVDTTPLFKDGHCSAAG